MVKFYLEVCEKLEKLDVPYMVSGSMAMTYYTTPRMTRDIDIVIHLQTPDLDGFLKAFEGFYKKERTHSSL